MRGVLRVAGEEARGAKAGRRAEAGTWLEPLRAEREIREVLGFEGRLETFDHHASHAASTFFYSGFPEAAVLTVDGVGEWATTMIAGVARRSTFPPAGYGVASTA